ncbi:MAG TPA: M28 family peptidase [Chitinophagaceae bacterium]|nr:M28 family peptidase [Chitinophagaceae bacterium]
MKKLFLVLALGGTIVACAQKGAAIITPKEVERIEKTLSADDMQGRRAGTPGIEKAASFIADEFKKAGLQPMQGTSFLQEFTVLRPKLISVKGELDGKEIDPKNIVVITSEKEFKASEKMGYEVLHLKGANIMRDVQGILRSTKNVVAFIDTSFTSNFSRLAPRRPSFKTNHNIIFILGDYNPKEFTIKAEHSFEETKMANVVGMLPGKSKKVEQVIFSGHYDHLGIGKPINGDSIYNGANDDAAGTTAVIMLANYYKALGTNERTLVFAAFTAEESGGFGAQYFSRQLDPKQVMAMFNIEMIGTESKWGKASAYITGYDKTNMGEILQKNLVGSGFTFHPDPYPTQNLFYRSDNATLARLGVPAHTISTSKMDSEPNYHKPSDDISTLDIPNMTEIIKSIAVSATSIINGKDTPTRVKAESLN